MAPPDRARRTAHVYSRGTDMLLPLRSDVIRANVLHWYEVLFPAIGARPSDHGVLSAAVAVLV